MHFKEKQALKGNHLFATRREAQTDIARRTVEIMNEQRRQDGLPLLVWCDIPAQLV